MASKLETQTQEASIKKRAAARPPIEQADAHREAVLHTVTQLFLEFGFAETSTMAIAKCAGASKNTLYTLYPSKKKLFKGLMHRYLDSLETAAATVPLADFEQPLGVVLRTFGVRFVKEVLSRRRENLFLQVAADAKEFPDITHEFWLRAPSSRREELRRLLDILVERKVLSIKDTLVAADRFFGSLMGNILLRFSLPAGTLRLKPGTIR